MLEPISPVQLKKVESPGPAVYGVAFDSSSNCDAGSSDRSTCIWRRCLELFLDFPNRKAGEQSDEDEKEQDKT